MSSTYASRRAFLRAAVGVAAAAPFVSRMSPVGAATGNFDPSFGTATEAVVALRDGVISSRELTQHVFTRIRKHNPKVNAFVTLLEEQALAQARQSDEHRSRGQAAGPLQGVPILIKDTYETAGVRTTCGSKSLENYVPQQDAVVVARLKQAGAIIVGKTNVPEFASDHQSYNDVAGTTNNPWDVTRTPGGSTGGGAAALAAGLGFLEIGSDIAGSIRLPGHFCGVYGHKPTLDIVHKTDISHRHPACCRVQPCCRLQARSHEALLICCSSLPYWRGRHHSILRAGCTLSNSWNATIPQQSTTSRALRSS